MDAKAKQQNVQVLSDSDPEKYFSVGLSAVLSLKDHLAEASRLRTTIRGWQRGAYVLLDTPVENGLLLAVGAGQPCVVRFVTEGTACGFDAVVVDRPFGNRPYFTVGWPAKIEVLRMRKQTRLDITLPCEIYHQDQTVKGEIRDLSIGGCKLQSSVIFSVATQLDVSFALPDGVHVTALKAEVRNVARAATGAIHGCRFDAAGAARNDIEFYIAVTERLSLENPRSSHVLVMDPDLERGAALRDALVQRGYQATATSGIVDGFARLRMLSPLLVVVHYIQAEIEGPEICRIIHNSRGIDVMPIFVYGGDAPNAEKDSRAAGAARYFGGIFNAAALADEVSLYISAKPDDAAL